MSSSRWDSFALAGGALVSKHHGGFGALLDRSSLIDLHALVGFVRSLREYGLVGVRSIWRHRECRLVGIRSIWRFRHGRLVGVRLIWRLR
jgi:hypothetical protein